MATIPIKAAVDSAAFVAFYDIFQKYQDHVEKTPDVWKDVADSTGETRKNFAETAKSIRTLADHMSDVLDKSGKLDEASRSTSSAWRQLAHSSKTVAGNIKDATESLMKWAGITSLVSGLAGYGALYGLSSLATGIGSTRSAAMGTGTSYGNYQAFKTSFGRLGDPEGFLSRINEAQSDKTRQQPFYAIGMGGKALEGDSTDVGVRVLERAQELLKNTDKGSVGVRMRTTGLDQFMTLEQALQLREMSTKEIGELAKQMRGNRGKLGLSDDTTKRWQDFETQLTTSKVKIETILVKGLDKIEPGLLKLSEAFTGIAAKLLEKDGPIEQWLGELNTGLEWLAKHIGTEEFKDEVKGFLSKLGEMAKDVWWLGQEVGKFAHWLAGLIGEDFSKSGDTEAGGGGGGGSAGGGAYGGKEIGGRGPSSGGGGSAVDQGYKGGYWTEENIKHAYDRLVKGGMNPVAAEGLIARWAAVESTAGGPTASQGGGAHYGIYQADKERQGHFGGSSNVNDQLDAVLKEMKTSEQRAGKAAAAAVTPHDGARVGGLFERGEGYDPTTGEDKWVPKTEAAMARIHRIVSPPKRAPARVAEAPMPSVLSVKSPQRRSPLMGAREFSGPFNPEPIRKVIVMKNTGANTLMTAAATAAPQ